MLNHGVKRRPMLTPPVASPKNVTEGSRQLSVRGGGLTQGGREPDRRRAPRGGAFPSRKRARRSKQFFAADGDIPPSPGPPPIALVSVLMKGNRVASA